MRIGVNGFGRIGRQAFKAILERHPSLELVAINDLVDTATNAHLLRHDSNYGNFPGTVKVESDGLIVNGHRVAITAERDWSKLDWGGRGIDLVIEATGVGTNRPDAEKHLHAGAKKVIISAPGKEEDITIVMGVNHEKYDASKHHVISNASCTTNCLAPVVHVLLKEGFGVAEGLMTTIHSYTATQKTVDGPSAKDWKGGRSAAINIIPSSTGAAKAVGLAIPEVKGKLTGMSFRVPTPTVSVVDLTVKTEKETSYKEISAAMKKASETYLKGILGWTSDEVVSTDFIHDQSSSVFDAGSGIELNNKFFKLVSWYDNEWGYSNRVVDLVKYIVSKGL